MNMQMRLPANTLFGDALPGDPAQYDLLNPAAVIGNNNPPADDEPVAVAVEVATRVQSIAIDGARNNYIFVAEFLADTPVIENAQHATKAANLIEQALKTVQDMEAERRGQVDPLNASVKAINDDYRLPRESIQGLADELKRRLRTYTVAEEGRRADEADRLRRAAEEAERVAREAEVAEQHAMLEADCGVVVDVGAAIVGADKAFTDFKKADRAAGRAENAITTRFDGGFGRRLSMRNSETLLPEDPYAAILEMGISEKFAEAILTAAREYRKTHKKLPVGITSERERKF